MNEILAWDDLHDKWLAEAVISLMDNVDHFIKRLQRLEDKAEERARVETQNLDNRVLNIEQNILPDFRERIEKLEMSNCTCLKPCPICKGLPVGGVEDALVHSAAHSNCLIHKKERYPSKDELMSDEIDLKAELKLELDHLQKQIREERPHKWSSAFRLFCNIVDILDKFDIPEPIPVPKLSEGGIISEETARKLEALYDPPEMVIPVEKMGDPPKIWSLIPADHPQIKELQETIRKLKTGEIPIDEIPWSISVSGAPIHEIAEEISNLLDGTPGTWPEKIRILQANVKSTDKAMETTLEANKALKADIKKLKESNVKLKLDIMDLKEINQHGLGHLK